MAYHAIVTDLTRPSPHVIMVHFDLRDTQDDALSLSGTLGFQVFITDEQGNEVVETFNQKVTRLRQTFDAYIDRLARQTEAIDTHFDQLRSMAIGYRYPAA